MISLTPQVCIMITIVVYLIGMLYIGWSCSKRNRSTDDFYLGGRKLGPFVTAMSAEASDMSSWLLMGLPGVAYLSGVADAGWTAIGLAVGTYINWLIVARRIRHYSSLTNSITLPDFFSKRFHDKKNLLCGISALVILIFFIPYTASGFAACGKLFSTLFGVDYMTAMLVSAAVIVLYCVMGGFLAASTTDFLQSIIMSIALVVILVFGVNVAGGMDAVMDNARSLAGYLSLANVHDAATGTAQPYGVLNACSMLAWGLGYFGMPHILLRFMAIEDANKLKTARRVGSIWVVISMAVAVFIGIMSTADSQLLAASSSISQNLMQDFFGVKLSQKATMLVARLTVVVIAAIGIFMARDPNSSVFGIVSFAWAGFGAAFGPVVLFSLFWKRTNRAGALAGMISGGAMIFIWKYLVRPQGGAWGIYELLPAFLVACIFIVVVSLVTKAPEQAVVDECEKAKKMR